MRCDLQADIDQYNARKAKFDRDIDNANLLEKVRLKAEKTAYQAKNGLRITYKEHWVEDINDGLKALLTLSHEVALALFFNPTEKADLDRTKALIDDYTNKHLLSMLGCRTSSARRGRSSASGSTWFLNALNIPALKQAIEAIKTSLYDFVLKSAFGMTTEELKKYLNSPETQFDPVMTTPAFFTEGGTRINRADFDSKELHLAGATFDYEKVPAAYNTVVLTKLLMIDPAEVNRRMRDPRLEQDAGQPSAILGFARTLDGSNQWSVNPEKMVAAEDVAAYRKIFMRQSGEKP